MIVLNKEQLLSIEGGAINYGTLMNYASKLINSILELGRSYGSAIRRAFNGKRCPI